MSDKVEFTPEAIAQQRELIEMVFGDPVFPYDESSAMVVMSKNNYPAALDEIERLTAELTEAREMLAEQEGLARAAEERIADLEAERDELRRDLGNLKTAGEKLAELLEYYAGDYEDSQGEIERFRKLAKQPEKGG
jgi:DNA repair exonuclease SbcCD ATPase subunit